MKNITQWRSHLGRTPVMPLMGYPGARLTNTSIKLNEFNWGVHSWSIQELYHRFRPDAVFLMMDLAVEASAIGLQVRFPLLDSPSVEIHSVQQESDLDQFVVADVIKDGRVMSFIETMKQLVQVLPADTLRGAYVTAPFTLAGLMMGANDIAIKIMLEEELALQVLAIATSVTIRYARALIAAGAQMVMFLDPTVVIMGPPQYDKFAKPFMKIVVDALADDAMLLYHVCGDSSHLVDSMCLLGIDGLSLDSTVDFPSIASHIPDDIGIIGNIDPVDIMMNATPTVVQTEVRKLREQMSPHKNFVLSTGCDLPLETQSRNIDAFMQAGIQKV